MTSVGNSTTTAAPPRGLRRDGSVRLGDLQPPPRLKALGAGVRWAHWDPPSVLDTRSRDAAFGALLDICWRTYGVDLTHYWEGRRAGGYFDELTQFTLLVGPDDELVGYTSYQMCEFAGDRTLLIDATGVVPEYQGLGLAGPVFLMNFFREHVRAPHRPMYMVVRTENPVVYGGMRRMLRQSHIFPIPGRPVPRRIQEIGSAAAEFLGQRQQFVPGKLKVVDAYPGLEAMFAEIPQSRDETVNELFSQTLTERDAFLLVGKNSLLRLAVHRPWYPLLIRARARRKAPK